MNKNMIRLGPLAFLLLIVCIALSTLGILSYTTARADMVLAERFASSVQVRYELEKEGSRFIYQMQNGEGSMDSQKLSEEDGLYHYESHLEGYTLIVEMDQGTLDVTKWQIRKDWDYDDTLDHLWNGE